MIADYFDADNKMLGYLMEKEVKAVDNILKDIKRPFTAIMGGSKVSTKIGIIENLMDKVDNLILCGGMTYTFAKAQGGKIGNSIVENDKLDLALDIIKKAKEKGVNLILGMKLHRDQRFQQRRQHNRMPEQRTFPAAGKVLMQAPTLARHSQRQSSPRRLSSGTAMQAYSSSTTSQAAHAL